MSAIKLIRKSLGMSQEEFAHALGVSQGTVSNMEVGRHVVRPDTARRVIEVAAAHGHKVTFDEIYGGMPSCKRKEAA